MGTNTRLRYKTSLCIGPSGSICHISSLWESPLMTNSLQVTPYSNDTTTQGTMRPKKGQVLVNSFSSQAGAAPLLMKMSSMFIERNTGSMILESKPKPRMKRHTNYARKIYTSNWTTLLMGIVTIFALYGEDLKLVQFSRFSTAHSLLDFY